MHSFHAEALRHKLGCQPVEQFRVRGPCAHAAKIIGCLHNSPAKVRLPNSVDGGTIRQWIAHIDDPISKRGPAQVRRWLYLAALRWLRSEPVRSWYARQKARRRGEGKPALIGVMRKLALALYRVGGRGEKFDRDQLYHSLTAAPV